MDTRNGKYRCESKDQAIRLAAAASGYLAERKRSHEQGETRTIQQLALTVTLSTIF